MEEVKILNLSIHNLSVQELLEKLDRQGGVVFTPNVDHLMKMQKDSEFYEIYKQSDYRVCDGQILFWTLRFLGKSLKQKISGSDFLPIFYQENRENKNIKLFLLGAEEKVAKKAKQKINQKVGREMVIDTYSPPRGFEQDEQECRQIIERINRSNANVLIVGLGAPKQEKWIIQHKKLLKNIHIFLAVGAAIDFEAGYKKRCPKWMSNCGLETPFRLLSEPRRLWKRYLLEHPPFFYFVFLEVLKLYSNPFTRQQSNNF